MDCLKKHIHVVAAVIIDNGDILCMQRGPSKYDYTSLKWEFPGGKVEPGETPEAALCREIREEMSMEITVGSHLITVEHEYPDFCISMDTYMCSPVKGRDFVLNEHNAFKWLKLSELNTLDWAAADARIVVALQNINNSHKEK